VITVATTLSPAGDSLIALAMPATVLFVESIVMSKFSPPVETVSVPVPTTVELAATGVD